MMEHFVLFVIVSMSLLLLVNGFPLGTILLLHNNAAEKYKTA